jgi:steroid 5-alpha reductase family enzyme
MRVLLMRVAGVSLLERGIGERRPGSADYSARTSAFPPRPPRG